MVTFSKRKACYHAKRRVSILLNCQFFGSKILILSQKKLPPSAALTWCSSVFYGYWIGGSNMAICRHKIVSFSNWRHIALRGIFQKSRVEKERLGVYFHICAGKNYYHPLPGFGGQLRPWRRRCALKKLKNRWCWTWNENHGRNCFSMKISIIRPPCFLAFGAALWMTTFRIIEVILFLCVQHLEREDWASIKYRIE
jgi:hypothetical protein